MKKSSFILFLTSTFFMKETESIKCYLDTKGIYVATSSNIQDRSVENLEKGFKTFDCNRSGSRKKITACMTKTSQEGLITRNCAPSGLFEAGDCTIHSGTKICFCTTDFCNGISGSSRIASQTTTSVLLSALLPCLILYTFFR